MQRASLIILSLVMCIAPAYAQQDDEGAWQFSLEPYVLATSISGDASVGRITGVPVNVSFSDILENLKIAGMLHFEALHENGWGLIVDYGFMDLGADTRVGFGGVLDASLRQGVLEALATRRLSVASGSLEVLAGVRWWDNKVRASFDPAILAGSVTARISEDWVDPVVGLRWTQDLADRWQLRVRGDIGGFDVGSDFSWNAGISAFYAMNERFALEMGYNALGVDYANGKASNNGAFSYDTLTHGPLLGLVIGF